jgi:hypothetical protein
MSCPSMNATGHGEMDFSGGSTGHGRGIWTSTPVGST